MAFSAPVLKTVPPNQRVVLTNEKVTGPVAAKLLLYSDIFDSGSESPEVLDNATGGGILIAELFKLAEQKGAAVKLSRVVAGDIDDSMLNATRLKKDDSSGPYRSLWNMVEVTKVDQQAIPEADGSFTHLFSNVGIFFCQDDEKALDEARRVLKPGGVVGLSSWKAIAWWEEVAQPALEQYIPDAPHLPAPGGLFPGRGWSDPEAIPAKLEKAGFRNVHVREYRFTPDVEAEEFAEATGVLVRVVASRLWTQEQNATHSGQIQSAIQRYLEENYEHGKWSGKMTALITTAEKA